MALNEATKTKTLRTVTETAAVATVLWRNLREYPEGSGVFPEYPVTCKYATSVFEVDEQGNRLHIIEHNKDEVEFSLEPDELYPLYLLPLTVVIEGQSVETNLGELLCERIDMLIRNRKLKKVIIASPASQTVLPGESVELNVRLNVNELINVDYTLSWYKDGILLEGVTAETFTVEVSVPTTYQAWVTTPFGIAKSAIAEISVS